MRWPHERQIMTADSRNHNTTNGGSSKYPAKARPTLASHVPNQFIILIRGWCV